MEKRPQERFQSAHDVGFALEAIAGVSTRDRASPTGTDRSHHRRGTAPLAMALLAVATAAAVIAWPGRENRTVPSFQRLTFRRGTIYRARFAPDNRTILYSARWDGKPSQVFTTLPGATEARPLGFPEGALTAVSPGGQLALILKPGRTLTLAMLAGGAPRAALEQVFDADWAPDGSKMAVVLRGQRSLEFPPGKVLYEAPPAHRIENPRFSPQGDTIAFLEQQPDHRGSLRLVDLAGRARILSTGWETLESLAWAPGGNEVWFTGSREIYGPLFIHAVTREGAERVVLAAPAAFTIQDVAPDGQVLLVRMNVGTMVNALPPGEANERDLSWLDGSHVTDLSRDGRRMLFFEWFEAGGPEYATYIRPTDGGPAVRLGAGRGAALSPDGRWAFTSPRSAGRPALVPTGAGQARELDTGAISEFQHAEWSADGRRIAFVGREPGRAWQAYVLDLDSGATRPVTPPGMGDRTFALSPDGTLLAAAPWDHPASLYPVAGGDPRPVPALDVEDEPVRWSADGGSIYVFRRSVGGARIFRVELASGRKSHVRDLAPSDPAGVAEVFSVVVTPDGRSCAYTFRRWLSDLYLVTGLR